MRTMAIPGPHSAGALSRTRPDDLDGHPVIGVRYPVPGRLAR